VTIPGPAIDQEALAKRYEVDQMGAQAGKGNTPPQTTSEPDVHEQAIEQAMHEEHRLVTASFGQQFKAICDQQLQLAEDADPQRLPECAANAAQEFRSHQTLSQAPLRAATRDKRAFAHVHRLEREAVYPESRALHMATLCFMTVVEASANAYAFSLGAVGLLGGLVQALMVAGLNVTLGCRLRAALAEQRQDVSASPRCQRQYKAAEAAYRHLKEQYFAGIQQVRDTYLDAVETCRADASRTIVAYKEGMAHAEQLLRRYIDITQSLKEACAGLIRRYRAANVAVRDEPEPRYFRDEPQPGIVPDKALLEMAALAMAQNVATHSQGQQVCTEQAAVAKQQIRDLYDAALDEAPGFFEAIESTTDRPWTDEYVMGACHDERQQA
jgi:hypothetical protein